MIACRVCSCQLNEAPWKDGEKFFIQCPMCGYYYIDSELREEIEQTHILNRNENENRRKISSYLRQTFDANKENPVTLRTQDVLDALHNPLPDFEEQCSLLILWLGDNGKYFTQYELIQPAPFLSRVSCLSYDDLTNVVFYLEGKELPETVNEI